MNKLFILPIIAIFASCSTPAVEKNLAPELYPTEKCILNYDGSGTILLIDKNHSVNDTILKNNGSISLNIDLIKRGYYEIQINKSINFYISITNPNKEIVNYQSNINNGLTYQFFNK